MSSNQINSSCRSFRARRNLRPARLLGNTVDCSPEQTVLGFALSFDLPSPALSAALRPEPRLGNRGNDGRVVRLTLEIFYLMEHMGVSYHILGQK